MNDLQYAGSHEGCEILYFPHAGHEFWFKKHDYQNVTLWKVELVDAVEQIWDEDDDIVSLPNAVRKVLQKNNFRLQNSVSSLEGAMSHG